MAGKVAPNIITSGLVLYLDAANPESYVSGSTAWNDISRGGNNGTLVNGPTFNSANGGSIVFDGVNDYCTLGNTVGNFGTLNFTISFFFKTTASNTPATFIAKSIGGTPTTNYGWIVTNGLTGGTQLGFAMATATGGWGISGSYSVQTLGANIRNGVWQMATVVGDRTQADVSIYLNGINQSLQAYVGKAAFSTLGNVENTQPLNLGSESDTGGTPFPIACNISQVQIYNRSLSQQEVLQNYNATKTRFGL